MPVNILLNIGCSAIATAYTFTTTADELLISEWLGNQIKSWIWTTKC